MPEYKTYSTTPQPHLRLMIRNPLTAGQTHVVMHDKLLYVAEDGTEVADLSHFLHAARVIREAGKPAVTVFEMYGVDVVEERA